MRLSVTRPAVVAAAALLVAFLPRHAVAQRALVYCPVGVDDAGCTSVVSALAPQYLGGVDRGYDGSNGTIDLATADLALYRVFVVPSLADGPNAAPYARLRDPSISHRLHDVLLGRVAIWSGSPDIGSANRQAKNALMQSLATWAAANFGNVNAPGLVALLDQSDDAPARYDWLGPLVGFPVSADPVPNAYTQVTALDSAGRAILGRSGASAQFVYPNIASYGFYLPVGGAGASMSAIGQTHSNVGGQVVLLTSLGGNPGTAVVHTDKGDYSPGEVVTISGSGFRPGERVTITFREDPEFDVHPPVHAVADGGGNWTNAEFSPDEHDVDVRFILTAVGDQGSKAQTTFTDGRAITSVTLAGGSSVSVLPGASIVTRVTVTTSGNGSASHWRSTGWRISKTPPGTVTCVDHANHMTPGTSSETFTSVAPGAAGTYNAYFMAYDNDACSSGASAVLTMTNAVVVLVPPTTTTTNAATGVVGGTVNLQAHVVFTSGGAVAGGSVAFSLNGNAVGTATTTTSGDATLNGVGLGSIAAGTYPNGVSATLAGNGTLWTSSTGNNSLTVTSCAAPAISAHPQNLTKNVGDAATFSVAASGSGTLTYQWRKGGVVISGATSSSYTIPSAVVADAGSYDVVITNACGTVTSNAATLTVNKVTPTITWANPADITYGTALDATQLNATAGVPGTFVYTPATGSLPNAGAGQTLHVDFTPSDVVNYNASSKDVSINVLEATSSVTVAALTVTYDGAPHTTSATVSGVGTGITQTVTWTYSGSCTAAPVNVSDTPCTATASYAGDTNHGGSTGSNTLTITKADAWVTVAPYSVTYDGAAHTATGTATGAAGADLTAQLTVSATSHTDAGSYPNDAWTFAGGANYNDQNGTVSSTIAQAASSTTVAPLTAPFDGNPHPTTATVTGIGTGIIQNVTWTYSGNCVTAPVNVTDSPCTATASYAGDLNHTGSSGSNTIIITGPACVAPGVSTPPSNLAKIVGEAASFSVVASGSAPLVYEWRKGGASIQGANGSSYAIPSVLVTDAGSYDVVVTNGCGTATSMAATLTVSQATPVITWSNPADITYGAALSATQLNAIASVPGSVSYTPPLGTVLDAGAGQTLHVDFTPADPTNYTAASGSVTLNVLKATSAVVVAAVNAPYDGKPHAATAVVSGMGAGITQTVAWSYTGACSAPPVTVDETPCTATATYAGDANHNGSTASNTISLTKVDAVITVSPSTVIYDGTTRALPGTATGIEAPVAADLNALLHLGAFTDVPGGTVHWTFDGNANYNGASGDVALTIDKAPSTTTVSPLTVTFDGLAHPTTAVVSGVGTGITQTVTWTYSGNCTGPPVTEQESPCTATADYAGDANHAPSSGSNTITITAAACVAPSISTSLGNLTRNVGEAALFTVSANGTTLLFQWRKDGIAISGATSAALSIGAVSAADAGSYDVVVTNSCGSASSNVAVLTVNTISPSITWTNPAPIEYSTALSAAELNATASVPGTFSYTPALGTVLDAGTAQMLHVDFTPSDPTAYSPASKDVTIDVLKAPSTVAVSSLSAAYDGAPHATTALVSGNGAGITQAVTWSYSGACSAAPVNVNETPCTATASYGGDANHDPSSASGTITLTRINATLVVTPYSVTYDGATHTATATATGAGGADLSSQLTLTGTTHTDAGAYNGDAWSFSGAPNYNDSTGTVDNAIAQAPSTTTVAAVSVPYDGNAHPATATVTGVGTGVTQVVTWTYSGACTAPPVNVSQTPCTASADYAGDANHLASSGSNTITLTKVNAVIVVTPYNVTYDGFAHTALGTATGVSNANLNAQLALSGTTHTTAGDYPNDAWSFAGGVNYNDAGGIVHDVINSANVAVLQNPGWESGAVNWFGATLGGRSVVSSPTHSGVKAQQLLTSTSFAREVFQDVGVTAGNNYDASAWLQTSGVTGGFRVMAIWLNSVGLSDNPPASAVLRTDTIGVVNGTVAWTRVQRSLQAPVGAMVLRLMMRVAVGSGIAWADDADVTAIAPGPPPIPKNVVIVLLDDMRADQDTALKATTAALAGDAVKFSKAFVPTPDCCPSRASLLTGQYAHRHGVWQNYPPQGGATYFNPSSTIATWLSALGVRTGLYGKYLNDYTRIAPTVPPGWSEFHAFVNADEDAYYGYKLADNGVLSGTFGTSAADYSTTLLGARAEAFVRSASATTPLFLYYTPFGPHAGINPTTAHPYPSDIGSYGAMPDVVYPSFNEPDVSDKPAFVNALPVLTSTEEAFQHEIRRSQLETLQSEDRMIVNLINALKQTGRWDSTLFVVSSDNGLSLGEHRLVSSKAMPYEESVHVPLWIHLPGGIAHADSNLVSLVDIAPTISEFFGFSPPTLVNGQSLVPLVRSPGTFGRSDLLIEELGAATTSKTWSSVRTHRYKYTEYANGDHELYDLSVDPFELVNVANDPAYASTVSTLSARLAVLRNQ